MKNSASRLSVELLLSLPIAERRKILENLDEEQREFVVGSWEIWANPAQKPPEGDWRIWLFLGGRGAGKTRAGAEWIAQGVLGGDMRRIALVGATFNDARAVMIEGESGLLKSADGAVFQPTNRRVLWPSGAVATVLSAEEPDGFRGHQFDAAWGDEFCKWQDPQGALDMLQMALRVGAHPRLLLTTTPRNIPALKALFDVPGTEMTHATTKDNGAHLAPGFIQALESRYGGTRLGRQELDAEIIADNEAALWHREWIEEARVREAPEMTRVVVAVDPAASRTGCECGIVVAGRAGEDVYVLADRSAGGLSPLQWATRVAEAYEEYQADAVVAEANYGGDMVKQLLIDQLPNARVRLVHATRGKLPRAAPTTMLYEQRRAHHAGVFAELEDQMCNYDGTGDSPDRMDALVWALAELFPQGRAGRPRVRSL